MAEDPASPVTGGCLCGAVRFRIEEPPDWISYCHCRDCRKATGAPLVAFVGAATVALRFEGEVEPTHYGSSPEVRRSFCPRCGSPIAYEDAGLPGMTFVLLGTLDRPEAFPPRHHAFESQRLPWLRIDDDLPRHARFSATRDDG